MMISINSIQFTIPINTGPSEGLKIRGCQLFGGHNLPPLVEIGLTDLPKIGGAMAPPAPPGTTGLTGPSQGLKIRGGS